MLGDGFITDELFDGRRNRLLTIVDHFTHESITIDAVQRKRGMNVVETLEGIAIGRSNLKTIQVNYGPEFISKALDKRAYQNEQIPQSTSHSTEVFATSA